MENKCTSRPHTTDGLLTRMQNSTVTDRLYGNAKQDNKPHILPDKMTFQFLN